MSAPVVTTYIRYLYPGTLEGHDRAVANRDPEQAVRNAPEDAYGFTFSERISAVVHAGPDREPVTLSSPARTPSGTRGDHRGSSPTHSFASPARRDATSCRATR